MSKALKVSHHSLVQKKIDRFKLSFHAAARALEDKQAAEAREKARAAEPAPPARVPRDPFDRAALHRLLLRATLGYQHARTPPEQRGWYFPDARSGKEQGPFPNSKMRGWFRGGHLAMAQPLRYGPSLAGHSAGRASGRDCQKQAPYVPLASLWPTPPGLVRGSKQQQEVLDGTSANEGSVLAASPSTSTQADPSSTALVVTEELNTDDQSTRANGPTIFNLDAMAAARDADEACAFPAIGLEDQGLPGGPGSNPNIAKLEDLVSDGHRQA